MARKRQPGRSVWLGTWASCIGGLLGAVFLIGATVPLARFALQFGPWEYFSLFVFSLSMVAGLTEQSLLKGFLSGAIGLVVTVIGADPVMAVTDLERMSAGQRPESVESPDLSVSHPKIVWEILSRPFLLLWSTVIGIIIGVLPAIGGSAANVLAYDQAKKFSRHPERFGTGSPEGIIAAESSNNANVAGSLVTIMAFGIPGDAVTAVMLGAMIIHGIQPGPLFIAQEPRVSYGIFAAYILAHPVMMVLQWLGARFYLKIVRVPKSVLFPVVLVFCVVGAYALNNIIDNVYVLLLFGVLGYLLVKFGFPLAPLILGVILGDQIEINLVRALMTDADPWLFVTRPLSGTMLALAVASVAIALWQHRRQYGRTVAEAEPDTEF
jgi:putative tricarboxylic transport membrane protein